MDAWVWIRVGFSIKKISDPDQDLESKILEKDGVGIWKFDSGHICSTVASGPHSASFPHPVETFSYATDFLSYVLCFCPNHYLCIIMVSA